MNEKPVKVVVKQTQRPDKSLRKEAELSRLIKDQPGSKHVVWTYGTYYEEIGQGTITATIQTSTDDGNYPMDPKNTKVGRIYLEYCENGDMLNLIRKAYE